MPNPPRPTGARRKKRNSGWTCEVCDKKMSDDVPRAGCDLCAKLVCPECLAYNGRDCVECT